MTCGGSSGRAGGLLFVSSLYIAFETWRLIWGLVISTAPGSCEIEKERGYEFGMLHSFPKERLSFALELAFFSFALARPA